MILFELLGREEHPVYQALELSNGDRQYSFLDSLVQAALDLEKVFLSQTVLKALNFQAIGCLHTNAGEYRPCDVFLGDEKLPDPHRVQAMMDDFVNVVNRMWDRLDTVVLAAYVLWRLNVIHPFINGNGRTARAACYFVVCLKQGGLVRGSPTLPQLLKANRPRYVEALKLVDASSAAGSLDLEPLRSMLEELLEQQIASATPGPGVPAAMMGLCKQV